MQIKWTTYLISLPYVKPKCAKNQLIYFSFLLFYFVEVEPCFVAFPDIEFAIQRNDFLNWFFIKYILIIISYSTSPPRSCPPNLVIVPSQQKKYANKQKNNQYKNIIFYNEIYNLQVERNWLIVNVQ